VDIVSCLDKIQSRLQDADMWLNGTIWAMSQPVVDEFTSIPKSTTDFICGRSWSKAFTSGVTMEKSPFSMVARRRGPKAGKSMSGMVFPRPFLFGWFYLERKVRG
jgi:hypothetical protein